MKKVHNYVEFLNALDDGIKKIEIDEEFYEWLEESIDLVRTYGGKNDPVATYGGMEIYVVKGGKKK